MNAPSSAEAAFSEVQKEYLQGFAAGLAAGGTLQKGGLGLPGAAPAVEAAPADANWFGWPIDEISREEQLKRELNPLDMWDQLLAHARENKPPQGGDVFRFKFHGLFYVAPAQDSLMVRVRIPGNAMSSAQMQALAGIAADLGGGYGDVTTRGNIQIREIAPRNLVEVLTRLADAALTSRGAGADNVRNITSSPLSGIDRGELIDTRPLARALQQYLLNSRDLYGLPRKFNISFDGAGRVGLATDTNDIGFVATRVQGGAAVAPGVYFRVLLGGITGHQRFAEDCGLVVGPSECVAVAGAMLRVFVEHGDRTDRKKARLCHVLDRLGTVRFLELVQAKLGFDLRYVPADQCSARPPVDKHGHLGIHPQSQPGLSSIGIAIPVGRVQAGQMESLAGLADKFGSGELRPTVWQNVVLPNVPDAYVADVVRAIKSIGFDVQASTIAGCVVACTGNVGCRLSSTDTKGQAVQLSRYLDQRIRLDQPINLHLTGCPNSCAQHCVADIGLLGMQVPQGDRSVEGYHVYLGGGLEQERGLGREFARNVPFEELPPLLERLLLGYQARRVAHESFVDFARRHEIGALRELAGVATA
ncbi:MAG TPA: NirA family protein [Burkholderiaceae bacterium]|nr:NirA family protein [Burkholderiaceae bacterium]